MRKRTRNALVQFHGWLALAFSAPLLVLFATGIPLAFKEELVGFGDGGIYRVEPVGEPHPPEAVLRELQERHPEVRFIHISFPRSPESPYLCFVSGPAPGGEGREGFRLVADPYTLEIVRDQGREGWIGWIEELHRSLWTGRIGKWITAASSLAAFALALSGLVVWWPIRKGTLRAWRRRGGALPWHNVLGVASLPVALVIAFTGASFSFGGAIFPLIEKATGSEPPLEAPPSRSDPALPGLSMAEAYRAAAARIPADRRVSGLGMPGGRAGSVRILLAPRGGRSEPNWERLFLDRATGEILARENFLEKGLGAAYRRSFAALHTGALFGLPGRVAWAAVAAALVAILATGFVLWLRRRRGAPAATE